MSLAVIAVTAPAADAAIEYSQRITGAVTITWRGDPARGCEEAGVCGIAGSARLATSAAGGGTIEGDSPNASLLPGTLEFGRTTSTVRVVRGPLDAPFGACTETFGSDAIRLVATRVPGGRARILPVLRPRSGPGFLAGRCAGPFGVDVGAPLPAVTVSKRRLMQGTTRLDFRGRGPFASGPFSGEVVSTLVVTRRARRTRSRTSGRDSAEAARARSASHVRGFQLELDLRLSASGALLTDFTGAPAPFCEALDACGMHGTHELAVPPPTGAPRMLELVAYGTSSTLGGRRITVAAALKALAAGRLDPLIRDGAALPATSSATVSWPEGPACRDTRPVTLPTLEVRMGRSAAFRLADFADASVDPFRTRCPGPAQEDVTRNGLVATGSVPFAQLAERRFSVRLAAPAPPRDDDFAVVPRGEIVLDLERTRARLRVGR